MITVFRMFLWRFLLTSIFFLYTNGLKTGEVFQLHSRWSVLNSMIHSSSSRPRPNWQRSFFRWIFGLTSFSPASFTEIWYVCLFVSDWMYPCWLYAMNWETHFDDILLLDTNCNLKFIKQKYSLLISNKLCICYGTSSMDATSCCFLNRLRHPLVI